MRSQRIQGFKSVRYRVLQRFVHFGVSQVMAFRLEARIPAKVSGSPGFDDGPFRDAAEEQHGRSLDAVVIGEGTSRFRRMILEAGQHPVQTLGTDLLQEPFNVRPRHSAECVETQTSVFHDDGTFGDGERG